MFALQSRCSVAVAARPSTTKPRAPAVRRANPLVLLRGGGGINSSPFSSSSSSSARGPLPAAAFGLGGGGNKNKSSSSSSSSSSAASDALASAAAEVEAAAAKVGDAVSEAAEALAAEVAAEAAEGGGGGGGASAAATDAAAATKSFVSPSAAVSSSKQQQAPASSQQQPPRPSKNSSSNNRRQRAAGGILSLPPFKNDRRRPTTAAARRARGLTRLVLLAGVAWALLSLGAAVTKVARRANSPRAKRLRTVDRNKRVVDALNEVFLPASVTGNTAQPTLTPALAKKLKSETGFTGPEVFRKYLWYLLRERRFDSTAVADLVSLRDALSLSDDDVASALKERAQRIYDKYGNVMMDVAGMTKAGIERKATCRALFSKLLYLAESEELLSSQESDAAKALDIPAVFGATDDDAAKLRIVSLVEVDLDKLEGQFGGGSGGSGGNGSGGGSGGGGFFDSEGSGGGGGSGGSGW